MARSYEPDKDRGIEHLQLEERPACIMLNHAAHEAKVRGMTFDQVVDEMAAKTSIARNDIVRLMNGDLPSPTEYRKILGGMSWSPFFLFGISEDRLDEQFDAFCYSGDLAPTPENRKKFAEICTRCLDEIIVSRDQSGHGETNDEQA